MYRYKCMFVFNISLLVFLPEEKKSKKAKYEAEVVEDDDAEDISEAQIGKGDYIILFSIRIIGDRRLELIVIQSNTDSLNSVGKLDVF